MLIANMNISSNTLEKITSKIELASNNITVNAAHIVEKAHDVSETHGGAHGGHGPFYQDPTFWVAISFLIVIVFLAKPVGKAIKLMLATRADKIEARLKEARELRDETQNLLAEYKRKYKTADKQAEDIVKKAKTQAEFMKKEAIKNLEEEMKIREKETANKIKMIEKSAINEINNLAVNLSIKAVEQILKDNVNKKIDSVLIEDAINSIPKKIEITKIN